MPKFIELQTATGPILANVDQISYVWNYKPGNVNEVEICFGRSNTFSLKHSYEKVVKLITSKD